MNLCVSLQRRENVIWQFKFKFKSWDIIAYADCFNIQSLFNAPKERIVVFLKKARGTFSRVTDNSHWICIDIIFTLGRHVFSCDVSIFCDPW